MYNFYLQYPNYDKPYVIVTISQSKQRHSSNRNMMLGSMKFQIYSKTRISYNLSKEFYKNLDI